MSAVEPVDVLVVGAGPTGLTLAAQLQAFGTRFRIVDRAPDQVHESRALAVQPRTLEILSGLGLSDRLLERGNPAVRVQLHGGRRTTELPLFDIGFDDTEFPFLLFVSQAETESVLSEHLDEHGVVVERGVQLVDLRQEPGQVVCSLRHPDSSVEQVSARYVVGCDGAHSAVRELAGIEFAGSSYPQTFVLADLDAEGLDPAKVHVFLSAPGMLFFFPLDHPAPWRLLTMHPPGAPGEPAAKAPSIDDLQHLTDRYSDGGIRVHDPVWCTYFRLQHRHAQTYRNERVFLAGDAAHVHSPAGAQGMNTGIQDAWNLGWKLALVASGTGDPALLDTYETERRPVGRDVLRFTDRAFRIATSTNPVIRLLRTQLAPRLLALASRSRRVRRAGLRRVAQLSIGYRDSPLSQEGTPRLRRGPQAGDRFPQAVMEPRFHLLLHGPTDSWPDLVLDDIVLVHRSDDPSGESAHYLLRPDGHVAYRAAGTDLSGLRAYVERWLPRAMRP